MTGKAHAKSVAKHLRVKRIYEAPSDDDGYRVLVDRLWPRGITKEKAKLDAWAKDLAPSDALRRRVHAGTDSWDQFVEKYAVELEEEPAHTAARELLAHAHEGVVTLLFAAKDETNNNAVALRDWLVKHGAR
jgi:uncharacterized protein YeaO (DUF488 family)